MDPDQQDAFRAELELVDSSLLPGESIIIREACSSSPSDQGVTFSPTESTQSSSPSLLPSTFPIALEITSQSSSFSLRVTISGYPIQASRDVSLEIRRDEGMDRDETIGWADWVNEQMKEGWNEALESGYPLYALIVERFLPVLQAKGDEADASQAEPEPSDKPAQTTADTPTEVLFTSHHLLAPSKRRDLHSLSSTLGACGFAKIGHPGIIYALCPSMSDAEEFVREVKSWQWLALKLRVVEEVHVQAVSEVKGGAVDAGIKWKGSWTEVDKMGEALEWMRKRKRDFLLLDSGFGAGGSGKA